MVEALLYNVIIEIDELPKRKGKGTALYKVVIYRQLPDGKEVVGVPARGLSRAAAKTCHAAAEFAFTFGFQEAAKRANWYLWSAQCVRVEPAV